MLSSRGGRASVLRVRQLPADSAAGKRHSLLWLQGSCPAGSQDSPDAPGCPCVCHCTAGLNLGCDPAQWAVQNGGGGQGRAVRCDPTGLSRPLRESGAAAHGLACRWCRKPKCFAGPSASLRPPSCSLLSRAMREWRRCLAWSSTCLLSVLCWRFPPWIHSVPWL